MTALEKKFNNYRSLLMTPSKNSSKCKKAPFSVIGPSDDTDGLFERADGISAFPVYASHRCVIKPRTNNRLCFWLNKVIYKIIIKNRPNSPPRTMPPPLKALWEFRNCQHRRHSQNRRANHDSDYLTIVTTNHNSNFHRWVEIRRAWLRSAQTMRTISNQQKYQDAWSQHCVVLKTR